MTRTEFVTLPAALALAALYDCLDEETVKALAAKERPAVPKQPLFDYSLFASAGNSFASECDLSQLEWHMARARKSVEEASKWAANDQKKLAKLQEWRLWRIVFPVAIWVGKRGEDEAVVAAFLKLRKHYVKVPH